MDAYFQVSTALNFAETVFRVALTFLPMATIATLRSRKILERIEKMRAAGRGKEFDLDGKARRIVTLMQRARKIRSILLFIPGAIVAFTLLAGTERTPLTGRCVPFSAHGTSSAVSLWPSAGSPFPFRLLC